MRLFKFFAKLYHFLKFNRYVSLINLLKTSICGQKWQVDGRPFILRHFHNR